MFLEVLGPKPKTEGRDLNTKLFVLKSTTLIAAIDPSKSASSMSWPAEWDLRNIFKIRPSEMRKLIEHDEGISPFVQMQVSLAREYTQNHGASSLVGSVILSDLV